MSTTSLHRGARLQHPLPFPGKAQELKTGGSHNKTPARQQGAEWQQGAGRGAQA